MHIGIPFLGTREH